MTIVEIESARDASRPTDFHRHPLDVPELSLEEIFYPLGFPTVLRTNSAEVLSQARGLWSLFSKRFDTEPIHVDVHLVEGDSTACPPSPVVHIAYPHLINVANTNNYSVANLDRSTTLIILSRAAVRHPAYLEGFLLASAPLCHIATWHTTPVHAGCIARNGRGVLLCGDSGAGKSTLSYTCARAGWNYVTDDSSYLLNGGDGRVVTGNCHQVRFRPSAAKLFPELNGLELTPRAAGKPSIELKTAPIPAINCVATAQVDFVVFLNRHVSSRQELVCYRKDVARSSMQQVLYGSSESLSAQYAALERLLTAEVFELRYTDLDWAVGRLESLTRDGR